MIVACITSQSYAAPYELEDAEEAELDGVELENLKASQKIQKAGSPAGLLREQAEIESVQLIADDDDLQKKGSNKNCDKNSKKCKCNKGNKGNKCGKKNKTCKRKTTPAPVVTELPTFSSTQSSGA